MVKDTINFVTDQVHTEAFGGPGLWGRCAPQEDSFNKHGHVATQSCATAVPSSTRHRDRHVVVFSQAADINVHDAIKVVPNTREVPRRSRFTDHPPAAESYASSATHFCRYWGSTPPARDGR